MYVKKHVIFVSYVVCLMYVMIMWNLLCICDDYVIYVLCPCDNDPWYIYLHSERLQLVDITHKQDHSIRKNTVALKFDL